MGDDAEVTLRGSISMRLVLSFVAILVGFMMLTVVTAGASVRERQIVLIAIAGPWLAIVIWVFQRPAVRLSAAGMQVRGAFRTTTVTWADVVAITLSWHSGRDGSGYNARLHWTPNGQRVKADLPLLARSAGGSLETFVATHGIGIELNPEPPWRDRTGTWHGEMLEFDPTESIRSIRRAAVGPWIVQIYPRGSGFVAITRRAKGGATVREGPLRASLAEAVADGSDQVLLAQREVELLP